MNHFINIRDISSSILRKIIMDAKKRKNKRKKINTLDQDKDKPLKGKLLIQMFEKSSLRTRLSFTIAIKQLSGDELTLRPNELHLGMSKFSDGRKVPHAWLCDSTNGTLLTPGLTPGAGVPFTDF